MHKGYHSPSELSVTLGGFLFAIWHGCNFMFLWEGPDTSHVELSSSNGTQVVNFISKMCEIGAKGRNLLVIYPPDKRHQAPPLLVVCVPLVRQRQLAGQEWSCCAGGTHDIK